MKKILFLLAGLAAAWNATGGVVLPDIIGSGMVLQRNASVRLWGWADADAAVKIAASWGEKTTVRSGGDGRWVAEIRTPEGGFAPQRITIVSGEKVTLDNILIGEVWFAGGQSNMEMGLGGWKNCPVARSNETIARAATQSGKIRYVKVSQALSMTPQERVGGRWREFTAATAPRCSAVGYFFAEMLSDALGVPVGIIDCTWGGSRVEGWLDRATLESYTDPAEELTEEAFARFPGEYLHPLKMYNGMVHPLAGYTLRGFLFYQGESNVGAHACYAQRLADLAALWRRLWGGDDLPFYYVEIAPFRYAGGDMAARLREAQCKALDLIPHSGMVSTNDLVEPYEEANIHPANKYDVGYRLACMALNKTYGFTEITCESPRYRSMEVLDGKICLWLDHAEMGYNRFEGIEGFEICGPDRVFRPAEAVVGPEPEFPLIVSSPEVPEPVAVRYCFKDFAPGNLATPRGLPVIPFRTDDFSD